MRLSDGSTICAGNLGIKISLTTNDGSQSDTRNGLSQGDLNAYSHNQSDEDTMTEKLPNGQLLRVRVKKLKVLSESDVTGREETGARNSGGEFYPKFQNGRMEADPRRVPAPCLRSTSPQPMQQPQSLVPDACGPDGNRRTDASYNSGREVSGNPYEPGGYRVNEWSSQQQTTPGGYRVNEWSSQQQATYSGNAAGDGRRAGSVDADWRPSGYIGQPAKRSSSRDGSRANADFRSEYGQSASGFTRFDGGNLVSGGDSTGLNDPFSKLRSITAQSRGPLSGSVY